MADTIFHYIYVYMYSISISFLVRCESVNRPLPAPLMPNIAVELKRKSCDFRNFMELL